MSMYSFLRLRRQLTQQNSMELSNVEQKIIEILRECRAHERVEVVKDQSGKPDSYFVHRSQKVVIKKTVD